MRTNTCRLNDDSEPCPVPSAAPVFLEHREEALSQRSVLRRPRPLGVDRDALDLVPVDLGQELRVVRRRMALARADQLLGEERQNDDDQDRKGCALEESAHDEPLSRHVRTGIRFGSGPGGRDGG